MKTRKIELKTLILILIFGMGLSACSSGDGSSEDPAKEDHSGHNHEAATAEDGHSEARHAMEAELAENEVLLAKKQMESVGIKLGEIKKQQLSNLVKSFGELVLAPADEATVSALIGGIVNDINVMEGDYVRKGATIARIVHPEIVNMQQDYLEARSQNDYLKAEYLRQKRLLEDSVNAEKMVQSANAAYQSNLAKMQSLKKKLQLINISPKQLTAENITGGYALKAPISGYVAQVKVNTGSHVTPQQSLIHVTANEKAHIDLKVFENDISKIAIGQKITFNLANNATKQAMEGEIMKMAKWFDTEQRTAIVHAAINETTDDLLPGMSVVAYIQTGGKMQNTLPEVAFVSDGGKDYVFLLKRGGGMDENHAGEDTHAHQGEEHVSHAEEDGHNHQHESNSQEATHGHQSEAGHEAHTDGEHLNSDHFYVFEKVQVEKEITQAGFSGFSADIENINKARFAISNAQAILSEMKKGGSGHTGHGH